PFCTHLVYGYAGINGGTNKLVSLNENHDLDQGKGFFRQVTTLKRKYPALKILLGVGGGADPESSQYLSLLESSAGRISFINAAYTLVKTYDFDGLDLSWQFPVVKPKKIRGTFSSFFHKIKKPFTSDDVIDEKSEEHKEEFTALVRELKNSFRHDNYQLALTVMPNVNSSLYFDVPAIINNLDYVSLAAFDFQTPDRNPKEADYPAPLYELPERNPESNVNYQLGEDSGITGVPPLRTPKEGHPEGPQLKVPGLVSYPEACSKLTNPQMPILRVKTHLCAKSMTLLNVLEIMPSALGIPIGTTNTECGAALRIPIQLAIKLGMFVPRAWAVLVSLTSPSMTSVAPALGINSPFYVLPNTVSRSL
uniref:GH18 domain-containing protein n=1 Tax=Lutzomyia longipalpis TaxID=7200 RepID=A0A1B0CI33_LUTLO